MNDLIPYSAIPLIGLYAETHYLFPLFPFSRYFRREPEIIFDTPYRLEPGFALPITLIIKDANRFPIELEEITLKATSSDGYVSTARFALNRGMECSFWYDILDFDLADHPPGPVSIDCALQFKRKGKRYVVHNDNHVGLSHAPLSLFKAADPLPSLPGWQSGELHCHTSYGADYVEFGAPLEAIRRTSEAIGLSWAALTDHSYNLDDLPEDYLKQDPELIKWELLQEESTRLSKAGKVILLPGEELSVRNNRGRNVHLIILGNRNFLYGSGDGAEQWLHTRSEMSIPEALTAISSESLAIAAHPLVPTPPLEFLLVGRGIWEEIDLNQKRLDGWQIANGTWGRDFMAGYKFWKDHMGSASSNRIFAGNDAHGNFNRFRQVKFPMLKLWEHDRHLFGKFRTCVKTDARSQAGIIAALKAAPVSISDGPAIELEYLPEAVTIRWQTTGEFGSVDSLKVFQQNQGEGTAIFDRQNLDDSGEIELKTSGGHIWAEIKTHTENGKTHMAIANG